MSRQKPNILFIFSDQQRWDTLGVYGNRAIRTPHLDALAEDGVRFDSLFTPAAVCSPSRASLLAGRYPHEHGVVVNNITLRYGEVSIVDVFREHGYQMGYIGKWHLTDVGLPGFVPPRPDRGSTTGWPSTGATARPSGGRTPGWRRYPSTPPMCWRMR